MKSTSTYIKENMERGRGVNVRLFGSFCFETKSGLVKPA
jgi:nucleoid DNA-binding protein